MDKFKRDGVGRKIKNAKCSKCKLPSANPSYLYDRLVTESFSV